MKYSFNFRTKVLFLCVILFALVLIGKLFLVQVVNGAHYDKAATLQFSPQSTNVFNRGTIYFERKDGQPVSAALQAVGSKVIIDNTKLANKEEAYEKLSEVIPLDREEFMAKAGKKNDPREEVASKLDIDVGKKITALKILGVTVEEEKWRFYPGENLASHTLGFVGYQGDELGGRYGIERFYEAELKRSSRSPYVSFVDVFSDIKGTVLSDVGREGDVMTTIEPVVQGMLEKELEAVKEKYGVDKIGGIIMNPKDGSIYAISAKPDFDPNNFGKVKAISTFTNPLVENVLEFGSVVKPLVMAAALDTGVVTANTQYNDTGSVIVEKKEIFNFDKKGRGPGTTMQTVLNQSLNTGMVFVERKLGKQKMHDYLLSFGIGEKTGIDLPNESAGLISNITNNLKNQREIEYANASFGQGIALSPVAMIRALASLGNGGNLVVPHVVKGIKYVDGGYKEMEYPTKATKISKATGEEITRMLVGVMDDAIQSGNAKIEHHSIAVKTGTAQVAKPSGGGYYEDRHTHSFFGYFPAYDPEFIVLLYAVNPKGVLYASQTWAPPFLNLAKFLISYYEVAPDR